MKLQIGEYHWRDGLTFKRVAGGAVRVRKMMADNGTVSETIHEFTLIIPPNEWASIVAAVAAGGDSSDNWTAASALHSGLAAARAAVPPTGDTEAMRALLDELADVTWDKNVEYRIRDFLVARAAKEPT